MISGCIKNNNILFAVLPADHKLRCLSAGADAVPPGLVFLHPNNRRSSAAPGIKKTTGAAQI